MPVRYSLEGRLFRMDLEGHYTPREMMETLEAALADPLFPADARFLLDVRESAELARRSAEQIRTVAEFFAVRAERVGSSCAILTGSPVQYGLARVGASAIEAMGVSVEVFSSLEKALAWLDLNAESE